MKYNLDLLKSLCERDKCQINFDEYNKLGCEVRITFICGTDSCNNNWEKSFRQIFRVGGFCDTCTKINSLEKFKKTNLQYKCF
jgi:hypothetical protein